MEEKNNGSRPAPPQKLSAGVTIRARIFGGDPEAIQFKDATEAVGLRLDYGQDKGRKRLPCISTAYTAFQKLAKLTAEFGNKSILLCYGNQCLLIQRFIVCVTMRWSGNGCTWF
jgi:hypothetical protein